MNMAKINKTQSKMSESKQTQPKKRSERIRQKHQQFRKEVLAAAREIMQEGGIETVTLLSVAEKMGLTKQAFYHYFSSKEALIRTLITSLLDEEIESVMSAIKNSSQSEEVLGVMIKAFYKHYKNNMEAFRAVYCYAQLAPMSTIGIDENTITEKINPGTRQMFDLVASRLSSETMNPAERKRIRRLVFTAWLSALGMMTMLGVAEAADDPLIHSDKDLLDTLATVFNDA